VSACAPEQSAPSDDSQHYVALSRVRTLLGLSMTELLEADPEYYSSDTSLLVHDANLAVQTLQTRLRYDPGGNNLHACYNKQGERVHNIPEGTLRISYLNRTLTFACMLQ
jgi:hypothetical protein